MVIEFSHEDGSKINKSTFLIYRIYIKVSFSIKKAVLYKWNDHVFTIKIS